MRALALRSVFLTADQEPNYGRTLHLVGDLCYTLSVHAIMKGHQKRLDVLCGVFFVLFYFLNCIRSFCNVLY